MYPTTLPGYWPRVVFSPSLVAGKTVTDSVTVSNVSDSALSFDLYSADAFNTPGGGLSLRRRVDPVEGIGAWIRLAHSGVVVPAHEKVAIPFVIAVPTDATPGDHVGGIVAAETTSTASSAGSVPITVIQAVGVRVYGRVTGPMVARLGVRPPHLAVHRSVSSLFGGTTDAVVRVSVVNRGNVVVTPTAHLEVTDTFGAPATRTFAIGPLLPGEAVMRHAKVRVRGLGDLRATVNVTASGVHAERGEFALGSPMGTDHHRGSGPGCGGVNARSLVPAERQITTTDRGFALTHNLGGYPGEMVSFVSVVGSQLG